MDARRRRLRAVAGHRDQAHGHGLRPHVRWLGRNREAVLASDAGPGTPRLGSPPPGERRAEPARDNGVLVGGLLVIRARTRNHRVSLHARHRRSRGVLVALRAGVRRRTDADSPALPVGPVRIAADSRPHARERPGRARRAPRREPVPCRGWNARAGAHHQAQRLRQCRPAGAGDLGHRRRTARAAGAGAVPGSARGDCPGGDARRDLPGSRRGPRVRPECRQPGRARRVRRQDRRVRERHAAGRRESCGGLGGRRTRGRGIRARRATSGVALGPGRRSRPRCRMGRHAISRQLQQRRGVPSPAAAG